MSYKRILRLLMIALPPVLILPVAFISLQVDLLQRIALLTLLAFIQIIMYGYIWLEQKHLRFNQIVFITISVSVIAGMAFFIQDASYFYMPLLIGGMLVSIVAQHRLGVMVNLALCLMVWLVVRPDSLFLMYYIIVGTVAVYTVNGAKERHKMLLVLAGTVLFAISIYALLAFLLFHKISVKELMLSAANVALSVIIAIGSLPLWESIFDVMTPLKLLEYANNDHKLMQRLLLEAPGTYHHVQVVGNLAERGARAVGADGLLAKTGAIFHDIGKLKEPGYFIENQNGNPNPHDEISAEDSAKIIIDHVAYGAKLASEHHIPSAIVDIIRQHHGTSVIKFFYHKAQDYNDGVTYAVEDFMYSGPKPQTKEAAVVMLADCVEAFVRSQKESERNPEKIRWIISEVIRQKFEEGQLDDSKLKVGELKKIGGAFLEVYNGLYHGRIRYPEKVEAKAEI